MRLSLWPGWRTGLGGGAVGVLSASGVVIEATDERVVMSVVVAADTCPAATTGRTLRDRLAERAVGSLRARGSRGGGPLTVTADLIHAHCRCLRLRLSSPLVAPLCSVRTSRGCSGVFVCGWLCLRWLAGTGCDWLLPLLLLLPSRRSSGRPRAASRATGPERRGRKQTRERDEAKRSESTRLDTWRRRRPDQSAHPRTAFTSRLLGGGTTQGRLAERRCHVCLHSDQSESHRADGRVYILCDGQVSGGFAHDRWRTDKIVIATEIAKSTKVAVTFDLSNTRNTSVTVINFSEHTRNLLNYIVLKFGDLTEFRC